MILVQKVHLLKGERRWFRGVGVPTHRRSKYCKLIEFNKGLQDQLSMAKIKIC